jgi:hypothetical protein
MHQVRAGRLLEQLHREVLAGVGAGRAIGEPAGRGLGALDHVANGLRAGRRIGHQDDGDIDQLGYGGELAQQIGSGIAGQIGIEKERSGRADAEGVAVGGGLRDLLQAERPPAPALFSTTTWRLSRGPSSFATMRAAPSADAPGANGTMIWIGFCDVCASAGPHASASASGRARFSNITSSRF